jgi:uncharacterized membrane protein
MAEVDNVVAARFSEPSKAYEALSVLKQCDADGRIGLRAAAIVEHGPDGRLRIPENADNVGLVGTAGGSLIGMTVGILGGPLGVLLGWGSGALIGGAVDVRRGEQVDDALGMFSQALPPGSNAVVADVYEPAVEVIDNEMGKLGGEVTRRPAYEVLAEVEAAEEAADAAAKEAHRVMNEQRKAELTGKLDERINKVKEKLHVS